MLEKYLCLASIETKVVGIVLFIPLVLYKRNNADLHDCNI